MKKFISIISLATLLSLQASAVTVALTIASGVATNIIPGFGSAKITQIIASTTGTNTATFNIFDSPTNQFLYTNAAYTNIISYGTNYVTTYTNYYGVTNSFTNLALFDASNTNAASTNFYPLRINVTAPSNSVTRLDNVNYYFINSPWVTNLGSGNITLTVTYQQ